MEKVEEGVSNFRDHAKKAEAFFNQAQNMWASDDKRRKRNLVLIGIISAVLTPGIYAGIHWVTTTISTILEIEEQWKESHPSEFMQQHSITVPENARNQMQSDKW